MVIVVKDFQWRQNSEKIFLSVPLNNVHPSKVDIILSHSYIKVHYKPFIFELFFWKKINDTDVSYEFTEKDIIFEIPKAEDGTWDDIKVEIDKSETLLLKNEAIREVQRRARESLDEKIKKKADFEKFTVSEAVRIGGEELKKIENARNAIKDNVTKDIRNLKTIQKEPIQEKINNEKVNVSISKNDVKPKIEHVKSDESKKIPSIRSQGTIRLSFTERVLPTPSRESTAPEEKIWLEKINGARRASGFVSEDLRPEECNPQWCKDKGDEFFRMGNYAGAVNAYTHGIKLSPELPSLFSNRAVTHFALGNYHNCIEDCSSALDLMKPHCASNLKSRIKCIVRRAAALTRIGMLSKAIDEMKIAVKFDPDNEGLKADLYSMERAWEQDPDSD